MSQRIATASLEFIADADGFFGGVDKIENRVANLGKSFAATGSNIRGIGTNIEKFLQSVDAGFDRAEKGADGFAKAVQRFSGTDTIGQANAYANAVTAIGGASMLTAKEQAEVNRAMTDALAKYRALGKDAPPALVALAEQTKRVEQATGNADVKSRSWSGTLNGAVAGAVAGLTVKAIELGQQLIQSAVRGFGEFIERGSRVAAMREGFTALAGGVDQASERIQSIRKSTMGLVGDFDIMQASNKAMLLGLGLNAEQMGELPKTAAVLGRAMGQDATKSLDDLITALGRTSPLILDNLGLSVKVGEANQAYARSIGKTASELTDAEKKQAFMNAAMDAAREKVTTIGGLHLTAADRVKQLSTSFFNLADAAGSWLVQLPVINSGLDQLSSGMSLWEALLREGPTAALQRYKDLSGETLPVVARLGKEFRQLPPAIKPVELSEAELAEAIKKLNDQVEEQIKKAEESKKAHDQMFGRDLISKARDFSTTLGDIGNVSKLAADKKRDLHDAVIKALDAYDRLGERAPQRLQAIADQTRELLVTTRSLWDLGYVPLKATVEDAGSELHNLASGTLVETAQATAAADKETNAWADTMGARLPAAVKEASTAIENVTDKLKGDFLREMEKFPATLAAVFVNGGGIESAIKSFTTKAGSDLGKWAGAAFGATGPWGQAIGGAIGSLAGLLVGPMKKLFGIGVNEEVKKATAEIDTLRNKLLDTHGTLEKAEVAFNRVGLSIADNWGHKGPAGLKAMNALMAEMERRTAAVADASDRAVSSFASVAATMTKPWTELGARIKTAREEALDAAAEFRKIESDESAGAERTAEARLKVEEAHRRLLQLLGEQKISAAGARQQLADLGTQAVASFAAALASGKTYGEAIAAVAPGLTSLGDSYKALGLNIEDAGLKQLVLASTVATTNPDLIAAAGAHGQSLQSLAQLGLLNVDRFQAMQRTAGEMYARLQSEFAGTEEGSRLALLPMQDFLHQAELKAIDLGVPLDANTLMLIEQSKELGIWKETGGTAQDRLIAGMETMVEKVSLLVDAFLGVSNAIGAIPDLKKIRFEAEYHDPGPPPGFGDWGGFPVIPMAEGGMGRVTSPTLFLAGEAGSEDYAFSGGGRKFGDGAPGGDVSQLRGEFRELRREMARDRRLQPMQLAAAIRTTLAKAGAI